MSAASALALKKKTLLQLSAAQCITSLWQRRLRENIKIATVCTRRFIEKVENAATLSTTAVKNKKAGNILDEIKQLLKIADVGGSGVGSGQEKCVVGRG